MRKYLSKSAPLVGFMASQSDGRPPHKSRCMSLWGLAQLKREFFGYWCHTLCVCVRVVSLPQGIGKRHNRIANELKLILKIGILTRESLLGGAVAAVVVVRCTGTARITALEMVFPELCNDRRRSMLSRLPSRGGGGKAPQAADYLPTNQGLRWLFSTVRLRKYSSKPCTGFACGCTDKVPST